MKVFEIFSSIQTEASQAGQSATFIRMAGCNLSCKWCDEDALVGKEMSVEEVLKEVYKRPAKLVVLTGGEPLLQQDALEPFVNILHERDYRVAVESNGTIHCNLQIDHLVISPKIGVPMKNESQNKNNIIKQQLCEDLKIVENGQSDEELEAIAKKFIVRCKRYLQPRSIEKESIARCVDFVMRHPLWRLSIQYHKLIGIQ